MFLRTLWGRGGRDCAPSAALAVSLPLLGLSLLWLAGCGSHKTAERAAAIRKEAAGAAVASVAGEQVADADKGPVAPKEPEPPAPTLTLELDAAELPPRAPLTGKVCGSWGADAARLLWIDGLGRVAGEYKLEPQKDREAVEVPFSLLPPAGCFGQQHQLVLVRASQEAVRKAGKDGAPALFRLEARAAFRVAMEKLPAAWDDYLPLLADGCDNSEPQFWRALARNGIRGGCVVALDPATQLTKAGLAFLSNAMPHDANPLRLSGKWSDRVQAYAKTRDGTLLERQPALFDEQALGRVRAAIEKSAAAKSSAPLAWSLGTGLSLTSDVSPFDYDMSPGTLDVFRLWLEDSYGSILALNRQWGTNFMAWSEVMPPTTDEAKAAHNPVYAAGLKALLHSVPAPAADDAAVPPEPAVKIEVRDGVRGFALSPEQRRAPGKENFSAWSDWREFNNFAFARLLREYRAVVQQAAGATCTGLVNAEPPAAWGGWDYSALAHSVDWIEEHESVLARELLRSLSPGARCLSEFASGQDADIGRLWDRWLRGDAGCILRSSQRWLAAPDFQPPAESKAFLAELRTISSGLTALRALAQPQNDGVALYYSPRSFQLHWMLDSETDGSWWLQRDRAREAAHGSALLQLHAWQALLEDLGYAPRFVSPPQLLAGALVTKKAANKVELADIKVLILPKVLSLSDDEAEMLRRFARAGGVVIADGACGTFDAHGKRREPGFVTGGPVNPVGALDRDFGIVRKDLRVLECNGASAETFDARVTLRDGPAGPPVGPESPELRVLEPGVLAAEAKCHGGSKAGAAALLSAVSRRGRFVYLNLSLQDYPSLRAQRTPAEFTFHGFTGDEYAKAYGAPSGGEALRLVIGDILGEVLPDNPLRVCVADGTPLRGVRRVAFGLGRDAWLFGVTAGTAAAGSAEGKKPAEAWAGMDTSHHWYDLRSGTYLGAHTLVKVALERNRATLLAALPYRVQRLGLKVRRTDARGTFKLTAVVVADSGDVGRHVFHIEVLDPSSQPLPHYTRNVVAEKGRWNAELPLALNEPAGMYQLSIRDVLTGQTATGNLQKDISEYTSLTPAAK